MLRNTLDPVLNVIYPQICHVCRGSVDSHADGAACGECWNATRIFDGSETLCSKCGAVSKPGLLDRSDRCGNCEDGLYDVAIAIGVYEKALAATVLILKKKPYLPRRIQDLLCDLTDKVSLGSNTVVVPVPLSKKRRFERGHNQADLIGRTIAKHAGFPFVANGLERIDHSLMHRIGMDKKAREATVKNSFIVKAPRLIDGKDVVLVDDVFTSGSTTSYCAKVLKKNGAASVKVITLARAVMFR